jgi:hypothetical protein
MLYVLYIIYILHLKCFQDKIYNKEIEFIFSKY